MGAVVGRALPFKIGSPLNYFQQFFKTDMLELSAEKTRVVFK